MHSIQLRPWYREFDYEPLPANTDTRAALSEGICWGTDSGRLAVRQADLDGVGWPRETSVGRQRVKSDADAARQAIVADLAKQMKVAFAQAKHIAEVHSTTRQLTTKLHHHQQLTKARTIVR